jgi:hypothetical protein
VVGHRIRHLRNWAVRPRGHYQHVAKLFVDLTVCTGVKKAIGAGGTVDIGRSAVNDGHLRESLKVLASELRGIVGVASHTPID